jgi:hypothetical protein
MSDAPSPLETNGQRRPTAEDIKPIMDLIAEGKSLRAACRELGLHNPSTHDFIHDDPGFCEQYTRAREQRAEYLQEDALTVTKAAALGQTVQGKKVDAAGSRAYLDAIKWAAARMAPKTAPVDRHEHRHEFGDLSDEELNARIAAKVAVATGDAEQP